MPPIVTNSFKSWLKRSNKIKSISNAAVTRVTYESITNFESLTDFDKAMIDYFPMTCKETIPAIAEAIPASITAEYVV